MSFLRGRMQFLVSGHTCEWWDEGVDALNACQTCGVPTRGRRGFDGANEVPTCFGCALESLQNSIYAADARKAAKR